MTNKQKQVQMLLGKARQENFEKFKGMVTSNVYAAIGIALYQILDGTDDEKADFCERLFLESQKVWQNDYNSDYKMTERFEELSGISVRGDYD